jgi:uncharacterized membrane protein
MLNGGLFFFVWRKKHKNMRQIPSVQTSPVSEEEKARRQRISTTTSLLLAFFVIVVLGVLYATLPDRFHIGPSWLPLVIDLLLIIPLLIAFLISHPLPYTVSRSLIFCILALATLTLITGVVILVVTLPGRGESQAGSLLRTASSLWISNILVFSLWYWETDGGGPRARHEQGHQAGDLLFPQQSDGNTRGWIPHYFDYLFVAFTGATALSPTDTMPLSRLAKMFMMIEALLAMIILVVVIARGVNIL